MDYLSNGGPHDSLRARYGPGTVLIERLFSRLRMLPGADLDHAVERWRSLVGPRWFAAERALGQAIAASRRRAERYRALQRLHELVWRRRWLDDLPAGGDRTSEAGAQYVVTTAVLALIVRDHLADDRFALLYEPVAELVPLRELAYDVPLPVAVGSYAVLGDAPSGHAPSGDAPTAAG